MSSSSIQHGWRSAFVNLLLTVLVSSQDVPSLRILKTTTTPNGFNSPPRGWNSFGLQSNPDAIAPNTFTFNQEDVMKQADALAELLKQHNSSSIAGSDYYISLDSGWSVGDHGDDNGRIEYDDTLFDIPGMAQTLHDNGLKLGVYVLPGSFANDGDKPILGTDGQGQDGGSILIKDTWSGNNNGFARMDFDFEKPGVQEWHNSVVDQFASW
jgi:alpha-galactosidase